MAQICFILHLYHANFVVIVLKKYHFEGEAVGADKTVCYYRLDIN